MPVKEELKRVNIAVPPSSVCLEEFRKSASNFSQNTPFPDIRNQDLPNMKLEC
jgi:hypothetical protein